MRRLSAVRLATAIVAAALIACQPKQTDETAGATPVPTPTSDTAPATSAAGAAGGGFSTAVPAAQDSAPRRRRDSSAIAAGTAVEKPPPHEHPAGPSAPNVSVPELVASGAYVGRRVHVSGRCLGYSNAAALGPPPLTRSDWQLRSAGATIFVSGPLPPGCSATDGGPAPVTILARVAEDTLPALGQSPGAPRRYLVAIRE